MNQSIDAIKKMLESKGIDFSHCKNDEEIRQLSESVLQSIHDKLDQQFNDALKKIKNSGSN